MIERQAANRKPLVSIIIPVYNNEGLLHRCVDSCLTQTHDAIEVILIDNGSIDSCGEICDKYASLDDRVKVIHLEKNIGPDAARNVGLDSCLGEWVFFADSDDWLEQDAIETLLANCVKNDLDLIVGSYYYETRVSSKKLNYFSFEEQLHLFTNKDKNELVSNMIIRQGKGSKETRLCCGMLWNKLISKRLIVENGLRFNPEVGVSADSLFSLYCAYHSVRAGYIKKPVYHYLFNADSVMHTYNPEAVERDLLYLKEINSFIEKTGSEYLKPIYALRGAILLVRFLRTVPVNPDNGMSLVKRISEIKHYAMTDTFSFALKHCSFAQVTRLSSRITLILCRFHLWPLLYVFNRLVYEKRMQHSKNASFNNKECCP